MRNAGWVKFDGGDVECGPFVPPEGQLGQPAFPDRWIVRKIVEHEIAEAVDDGPVFVPLHGLRDVGVAADDGVKPQTLEAIRFARKAGAKKAKPAGKAALRSARAGSMRGCGSCSC